MSGSSAPSAMSRRELLMLIGSAAGSAVSYRAMASMGLVSESNYGGPVKLEGSPKGASVLILGAGLAGMVAAYELRKAGYKVQVLEYNNRAGGRNWTLRGGDSYTELGGFTQKCEFDAGLYLNPGPWRIPYHHHGVLDYCRRLGVALEPFVQVNYNAMLHSTAAFGGKPQRYREVQADFNGHVAELLAKVTSQKKLDQSVGKEDQEILLEALKQWGALDKSYAYKPSRDVSERRGYEKPPGGGLSGKPVYSKNIIDLGELLKSELWGAIGAGQGYEFQTTLFQPIGGMGRIGDAFKREVGDLIRFNAKVTSIKQDNKKVTVTYVDPKSGAAPQTATADWCLCTIPLSVLSQIDINVNPKMRAAINAVPYEASAKVGLQFKRRFWEQDEH
ncbi:MAG: FAD-dependent oxidoreductase, partial [Bradyrhizobium sp.]